jgi:hypothetical protein
VRSDNEAQTSGLIAASSSWGKIGLFGPVLTQESAISPLPLELKLSSKSLKPPLKSPPTLVPLRMPPKLPTVRYNGCFPPFFLPIRRFVSSVCQYGGYFEGGMRALRAAPR